MYTQKVSSMFIGVHPANRDGFGVSAKHVHELLDDLVSLGWSQAEFRGLCVEVSDSERPTVFQWNQELAQQSGGQIPQFQSEGQVKYATIGGSHTNMVLRCFLSKTASSSVHRSVTDGTRLSTDKLREVDKDFWEACTDGATWRVISSLIPETFPSFCGLAQSAANAAGHVAREESELHLCRKIHTEVGKHYAKTKDTFVSYQDVKDAVLRSKPRAAATVPALFAFTLRYSGGQAGHLLQETEKFVRGHGHNSRVLGPEIYEGLNAELRGRDPQAQLRHMILHFAYTVEEARTLTISDIKKLLSSNMSPKTAKAIETLQECKQLCKDHDVPGAIALKALGFLQVNMVAVLLEKKKVQKHQTLQEAAEECVNLILREASLDFQNPFEKSTVSSSSKSPGKGEQGMVPLAGRC